METDNRRGVLLNDLTNKKRNHKKFFQKKSLQACGNSSKFVRSFWDQNRNQFRRASLRLSVGIKASVSIEASIAIPIFVFCFLEILSLLNYISVYSGILYAMKSTGDPVCVYGCISELQMDGTDEVSLGEKVVSSVIFSEVYLDSQIRRKCSERIYENTIENGVAGISMLGSYVDREEGTMSIMTYYTMKPLISFAGTELPVLCRYYGRLWTGYSLDKSEITADYVYITETGRVYHLTEGCTYLKLSISSTSKSELKGKRNAEGRKYKPCEVCCDDEKKETVCYITNSGEKYHFELGCSGLKRTVYRVEKSEVEEWTVCSRCAEKEKG